jgi:hypothetical protein
MSLADSSYPLLAALWSVFISFCGAVDLDPDLDRAAESGHRLCPCYRVTKAPEREPKREPFSAVLEASPGTVRQGSAR